MTEAPKRGRPKRPASRRSIHRDFWRSRHLDELGDRPRDVWQVFQACILEADDFGRLLDDPSLLWLRSSFDHAPVRPRSFVASALDLLCTSGLIVRYHDGNTRVIQVRKWSDYQVLRNPCASKYAPPPEGEFLQQELRKNDARNIRKSAAEVEVEVEVEERLDQKHSQSPSAQCSYVESPMGRAAREGPVENSRGDTPTGNGLASAPPRKTVGAGDPDPEWPRVSRSWRSKFEAHPSDHREKAAEFFRRQHGVYPWEPLP